MARLPIALSKTRLRFLEVKASSRLNGNPRDKSKNGIIEIAVQVRRAVFRLGKRESFPSLSHRRRPFRRSL
jgi:hypothetical protein